MAGTTLATIGMMGALARRQDAGDRSQTAHHHCESFDPGIAVWLDATGGSVPSGQEDIDVGRITGAIVPELRVLNDQLGDPIEIGDDPAEMTLYSLRPTGPPAQGPSPATNSSRAARICESGSRRRASMSADT